MAQWVTKFVKRASNSGTFIIAGKQVNRGAGYGLELPREFKFQEDTVPCALLEEKLAHCKRKKNLLERYSNSAFVYVNM